jgi:hypothetical protein
VSSRLVFDQVQRVGKWVAEQTEQTASWGDFYAIGVEKDGEIVAGVVINNYNGTNATVHQAVKGFSKLVPKMFFHVADYSFNHCKLKRLTGMVPTSMQDVIAFNRKHGFEDEFVMKCGAPDGEDLQVMVLWPENCRWLKPRIEV